MDWATAEAALDAAAASVFDGLDIIVQPRTSGLGVNAKMLADDSRAAFLFRGSLDLGSPGERSDALVADPAASNRTAVRFEGVVTAHDGGAWPYAPRRRDHLDIGGVTYDIADVARDGTRRRVFYVNRV